ncbi:hypothetical protein Tco_0939953 [Tanacetum coccineum]|uniref:Reverse transcriptase domain-containing protein n=1 Tax=Tanacetum coccineum TaxID=301880 RepID=A0ABQ5DME3_9ASTR
MAEEKEQSFVESVKEKITETFDDSSSDSDNEAKKKSSSSSAAAEVVDDVKDKVYRLFGRQRPVHKCMRTRSQSRNLNRQQQQAPPAFVEPFNLEEPIENPAPPVVTMDDTRTMAQLLEAPTEGYEDAIVVPEITADNFELKHDHFYDEVPERPEKIGKYDKLPVIIAKDLKNEEKAALIEVLKSHKRAIGMEYFLISGALRSTQSFVPTKFSWKRTTNQLWEDETSKSVKYQNSMTSFKKEVEKLLDADNFIHLHDSPAG